jgi:hypothetical protein
MKRLVHLLQERLHLRVCAVHLLESQFITSVDKFFAGVLTAMSAMIQLELPHINILSKMDLLEGRPGQLDSIASISRIIHQNLPTKESARPDRLDRDSDDDEEEETSRPTLLQPDDPDAPQSGYTNTFTEAEDEERTKRHQAIELDRFLNPDPFLLVDRSKNLADNPRWQSLNQAIVRLV